MGVEEEIWAEILLLLHLELELEVKSREGLRGTVAVVAAVTPNAMDEC